MFNLLIINNRSEPTMLMACERLVRSASSIPNMRNASRIEMNVNTSRNFRRRRLAQTIGSQRNIRCASVRPRSSSRMAVSAATGR